jgi:hypothetical protein
LSVPRINWVVAGNAPAADPLWGAEAGSAALDAPQALNISMRTIKQVRGSFFMRSPCSMVEQGEARIETTK